MISAPRLAVILPRGMYFGSSKATSIDLCARDFVRYSKYYQNTTIFCEEVSDPFDDVMTCFHKAGQKKQLYENIKTYDPDLVLVHQHQPTAYQIAKHLGDVPVLLHRHNFVKHKTKWLSHFIHRRRFEHLSGLIFVSTVCRGDFLQHWPDVQTPSHVIHNGLDFSQWSPQQERENCLFFAGRMAPEKGVLELAKAAAIVLPKYPNWTLRLIVSRACDHPDYKDQVLSCLSDVMDQVDYLEDQPFQTVKEAYERAAISLVPSKFEEPFGRTAIEAFAGASALITSGTGGLKEVVGQNAVVIPDLATPTLTQAMESLLEDPQKRQNLAEAGRNRGMTTFSIQQVTNHLDLLYDRYLSA
ncbi:MAG: glycosyltransferase family 4 protein [Cohaesibacter sp.]|nr:glycosyltransferase family 4 protein [Cohaesibacter sp.]